MKNQLILGFHHYSLRCKNLPVSVLFYETLGFRQVHHWRLPQYSIEQAVMMQAPDHRSWIELFDLKATIPMQGNAASDPKDVVTGALAHICLTVSNLDLAIECAVQAGATKLYGPERLALGEPPVAVHNAILEGPAGEIIELLEQVVFPGDFTQA